MNKNLRILMLLIAGTAIVSCAYDEAAREPTLPEPTASAVWNYLQAENYEARWAFWPGKDALYEGQPPHGAYLTTYVNPLALDALTNNAATMPTGSFIVKENYSPEKTLAAVTVMYKAPAGYNPEHNDWFWLKRTADGEVEAAGRVDGCQNCHQTSQRDYLLTPVS